MIQSKKVTLHDLLGTFAKSQIRVPDYQRGYSWGKKEVGEFFTDLTTFAEVEYPKSPSAAYFLGPIVTMQGNPAEECFFAVDGQQRIATLIILLATIRDLSEELLGHSGLDLSNNIQKRYFCSEGPDGGSRWSLRLGDIDQAFFEKFIQKKPRAKQQFPRNASNGLIKRARNQLEQDLRDKLAAMADPLEYLERLYKSVTKHVVMVDIQVERECDAMNVFERINARGKPLSEADLVRHVLMYKCTRTDRPKVRREWDGLENLLGGEDAKIDTFLKHMWISRASETGGSKLYNSISGYLDESGETSLAFAEECGQDCIAYTHLLKRGCIEIHNKSREAVWAIHTTLGRKQALPLLLAAYRRFRKTPEFSILALAIESVVVRHGFLAGHKSSDLDAALYKAAKQVRDAPKKDSALQRAIDTLRSVNATNQEVIAGTQRPMTTLNSRSAIYILRQLENLHSYEDDSVRAQATLEHIFPQRATVDKWPQAERLKPYLWHFGNLALLTKQENAKAGNRKYVYKKNKVYHGAALQLTSEITNYPKWSKAAILRRAADLAKLANRRWNLDEC